MSLACDLLEVIVKIANQESLPTVETFWFDSESEIEGNGSNFGILVLSDGTAGLTYTGMGEAKSDLRDLTLVQSLKGSPILDIARLYTGSCDGERVLGMAAINAASQYLFAMNASLLEEAGDTLEYLELSKGDHLGMVGYFPPLVAKIREMGIQLTVVELDPDWLESGEQFEVTLDPSRLNRCNKILCTGTVLVNHTLDSILGHARDVEKVILVGPTVGCIPDPLFARKVTAVGGRKISDLESFLQSWRVGESWHHATRRYSIEAEKWPGYQALFVSENG